MKTQIRRLSRLWFEALTGICAHVRGGGGGLTPSDVAPARLTQEQIDELQRHYQIADILPLTPLQQGLLFHANTALPSDDHLYVVQLEFAFTGALDARRLRDAMHTVVARHPNLVARFSQRFDEPVQIIPADPAMAWRTVDLGPAAELDGTADPDEQIKRLCATERAAVYDLADQSALRVALIRTARRSASAGADHSSHRARWLVPADLAGGDIRQLQRPATTRHGPVSDVCELAGRSRPRCRPRCLA